MKFPLPELAQLRALKARLIKAVRRGLRNPLPRLIPNWENWSPFRRHFVQNLCIGVLLEILVTLATVFHFGPVVHFQNTVLEGVMGFMADSSVSHPGRPHQVFIEVDEETYRSPEWGGGEPRHLPLDRLADLIEFAWGSEVNNVLLDFSIDGPPDASDHPFKDRLSGLLERFPNGRLLTVRTFRPPLHPHTRTVQEVRPSMLDELMQRFPERVHAVAPNFLVSIEDNRVRYWRLWESACQLPPDGKDREGRWVVIPSPQLVLHALNKLASKPDLPPWGMGAALTQATAPCAVDGASMEVMDRGENSAQADFHAGRWVLALFGETHACYQQDLFTAGQCGECGKPHKNRTVTDETNQPKGEQLGNRIFFTQSDRTQEETRPGRHANPANPFLTRVSALAILKKERAPLRFQAENRPLAAIIGSSYRNSGDWHQTPLGQMPGSMLLINAIDSMQTAKLLQSPNTWIKFVSILLVLVAVSAVFARLPSFWAALSMFIAIALVMAPLSVLLVREQGIWLDFALPLLGIYLHHEWESAMEFLLSRQPE